MTDQHDNSGVFDLVVRTVDESEKRWRPEIAKLSESIAILSRDVHDLRLRREVDTTGALIAEASAISAAHNGRIGALERWRAFVTGAVAILSFLAVTFGVLAYQTLSSVEKDVAVLKSRSE
jgi:hypothetical protein